MLICFQVTPTTVTDIFDQIKGRRTKEISAVQATGSTPLPPADVIAELYAIAPNAAFFTTIAAPGVPAPTATTIPPPPPDRYPKLLTSLHQDPEPTDIDSHCLEISDSYKVSPNQSNNLEVATRNQSISPLWYQHRMGRVTASKAHDVMTQKPSTPPDNLVKRIAGYTSYDLSKRPSGKMGHRP